MRNKQAIISLFLANSVSGISQGICMIAIPWYFTAVLGFHTGFGLFYASLTMVSVFWSIYAGTIIDKFDRKKILIAYSVIGCVIMSLASLSHYTSIPLWIMGGFVFAFTILLYNIHYMNIYSFAQEITDSNRYNKIISYLEIQGQATTIFGGALAAILMEGTKNGVLNIFGFHIHSPFHIEKWNLYQIFGLDAITYFIAVFILFTIRYTPIENKTKEIESAWNRVKIGWNFLKTKPALLVIGWASSGVFISVLIISFYLMPSYISNVLNEKSDVFASSELYFALGAMMAGFLARYFLVSRHEVVRILILFGMALLVFLIFIFNINLYIFYFANILFGFSNAAIRFNRVSYFWKIIPNHLMGRASSVINISSYILRAFWGFVFAFEIFNGKIGIIRVMLTLFVFNALCGLVIWSYYKKLKDKEFQDITQ